MLSWNYSIMYNISYMELENMFKITLLLKTEAEQKNTTHLQ